MKKRVHIYYSGRVQGVGFRYTARDIAEELGVWGRVKNLADGRVELNAEAEEDALNNFQERIKQSFSRYIRDTQLNWGPASGEYNDFRIEF
ncbi:MAG: acylphosphatase [Candidatus Omnitrophota bacterium]|nr:acylphosphatase [Candidatus Omnitrophota bacterium]MBU1929543.1 acylphosphatase [Candidatus Omnitrophota bacterium]MBU2035830.1 acylphosphatase [Candidatus Omnitrophota bacterium]MBU2258402.1 acylphosphatase [Candidatus Omnitrophota bacterium]